MCGWYHCYLFWCVQSFFFDSSDSIPLNNFVSHRVLAPKKLNQDLITSKSLPQKKSKKAGLMLQMFRWFSFNRFLRDHEMVGFLRNKKPSIWTDSWCTLPFWTGNILNDSFSGQEVRKGWKSQVIALSLRKNYRYLWQQQQHLTSKGNSLLLCSLLQIKPLKIKSLPCFWIYRQPTCRHGLHSS